MVKLKKRETKKKQGKIKSNNKKKKLKPIDMKKKMKILHANNLSFHK